MSRRTAFTALFLAIPVAAFFHMPPVRWVITVLSLTFITTGLRVLPRSLLTRDWPRRLFLRCTKDG